VNHAPPLTVIVPSYKRPDSAIRAIRSLQAQDTDVEILLVDNEADPAMRDAIAALNVGARLAATWIPESRLGAHHARHAGALHARSELLGFVDDDATFAPGWARAYIDAFAARPEMAAASGPLAAAWEAPPPAWLKKWVEDQQSCFQYGVRDLGAELRVGPSELFWSGNMVIRREVLFAAGGFHPDTIGDRSIGDGESGLFDTLRDRGAVFGYVPGARANHHIPQARMNVEFVRRRMRSEGAADAYSFFREQRGASKVRLAATGVMWIIAAASACLMALPLRAGRGRFTLGAQLRAARLTGRVAYAYAALRDIELRRLIVRDNWLTSP
jgi:glycosyltransferase involved in cell wall biosynthesis